MTDLINLEPRQQGLVPAELMDRAREYAKASKSAGTIRAYRSVWRTFTAWCESRGLTPCPATPEVIVAYIADQGERLRPQTIEKHLAAISQAHKVVGFTSPVTTEPVRLVMQGLRRTKGVAANPKKALRIEHLKKMISTVAAGLIGQRDRAILLLGFLAGMRRSELVGLDVGDIQYEPEGATVIIRRSKRDQEGRGRKVGVPFGHHEETCTVRAIRAWVEATGVENGPLFFRLDRAGQRQRLDGRGVAHVVKRAARRAGLDPALVSAHSLRRGFCTEASRGGASETEIARTTGHTSMAVLRGYVEAGTRFSECAASRLDL